MSGGHFDYKQHYIADIINDIEQVIENENKPDYDGYKRNLNEESLGLFNNGIICLKIAQIFANRIDWFLSGDDGEETFQERLTKELLKLEEEVGDVIVTR